jgi:cell division protein FtsB
MEPKGLRTLLTLHEEASKLQLEIGHLSSELEKFKREWELLQKDRVYLERVVRTESGYLAPNEILIEWLDKSK